MNRNKIIITICLVILLAASNALAVERSGQKEALAFYKGKTLRVICLFSVGGGYDTELRIAKPFFDKYLPGTNVVIENIPGAGGNVGANMIYKAKPDGLTIGVIVGGGITSGPIAGDPGVRYDTSKFTYLGSLFGEERMFSVRSEVPINNVTDLMSYGKQLRMPFKDKGGASYITAQLLNRVFPTKMEIKGIFGFPGTAEQLLALKRGEVDIFMGSQTSSITQIRDGVMRPLYLIAKHTPKGLPADLPNLWSPKGQSLVPEKAKPYMKAAIGIIQAGRPIAGPPGIPKERALFLESIIKKIYADPKFIQMADKIGGTVDGSSGTENRDAALSVLNAPEDVKKIIREAY